MAKLGSALVAAVVVASLLELVGVGGLWLLEAYRPASVLDLFIQNHFGSVLEADLVQGNRVHDAELGWDRQPNQRVETPDVAGRTVVGTSGADGSRVDGIEHARLAAAAYGGSVIWCAEVNDDETFEHFLEERIQGEVKNFGVAAYDVVQAVLKFKRHAGAGFVAPVTILGLHESYIEGTASGFRPFFNPGTAYRLGFKPSYRLVGGQPELVPNRYVDVSDDIAGLERIAWEVAARDVWAGRMVRLRFPFSVQLIRGALAFEKKEGRRIGAWEESELRALLDYVVRDFVETARSLGSTPVLLFIPTGDTLEQGDPPGYARFKQEMRERDPELAVIDVGEADFDAPRFSIEPYKGHVSVYGNRIIAALLEERLGDRLRQGGAPVRGELALGTGSD